VAESRPIALPPDKRTVGQLVAESVRFYGDHFLRSLWIGVAPATLAVVTAHISRTIAVVLAPTLYGAVLSAAFVYASTLVLDKHPSRGRLAAAWGLGWVVFAPVTFLIIAFVLPALVWLAALGLVVPVLVAEPIPVGASLGRAWRLARADFVHALGTLATLAIVVFLTQTVLIFLLRGEGGAALTTALFLANAVISPMLFIGSVYLYLDQVARVK
jgi:hypothetical protein